MHHQRSTVARFCTVLLGILLWNATVQAEPASLPPTEETPNHVVNGDAELSSDEGKLANWSVYVRTGKATLAAAVDEKTEGHQSARLELGSEGANFDVRVGHANVPVLSEHARYLFSADVKCDSQGDYLAAYFSLGVGSQITLGKIKQEAGWQKVSVELIIPANARLTRLELNGGAKTPAVIHIDNVQLRLVERGIELPRDPLPQEGIRVNPGEPITIRKLLPLDSRLVRAYLHAPIDGRTDTRYATGVVHEWSGLYGAAAISYRDFNGNNGLHISLPEGGFDAMQIRGGWQGIVYGDYDGLKPPAETVEPLCLINSSAGAFRKTFDQPVHAKKLSFFYSDVQNKEPFADATFLRRRPGVRTIDPDDIVMHIGKKVTPPDTIQAAIASRFADTNEVLELGDLSDGLKLIKDQFVHLLTPLQSAEQGVTAVTLDLNVTQLSGPAFMTIRVHDVLDARREIMGVDLHLPGSGRYQITLDVPDQVFLNTERSVSETAGIEPPFTPPSVLWISLASGSDAHVDQSQVILHRVNREEALQEAGAWRKMILAGLFSIMSEPRPWMHLQPNGPGVREQIATSPAIERYRSSLLELLENAEAARALLPEDDIVRQYHAWLYQNMHRNRPLPSPVWSMDEGAPQWAIALRDNWREVSHIAQWWLDQRLVENGELGGNPADDTDMFQTWAALPMIESSPLGARLKSAAARLSDLTWQTRLEEGINIRTTDGLHAYEEGINQLALCAWWFYGDPVHYERVMISAGSVLKLLHETEDGRLHFPSNYVGIREMREGYKTIGATPGDSNWAPIRYLWHPVYVAAMYNRHPALVKRFEQWGSTWARYQKPGEYVGRVDIPTGKPLLASKLPSATAAGTVEEWLALYQITRDPKWQKPFEMMMDSKGYWGTTAQYGRMTHALVDWPDPYQQQMNDRIKNARDGYAAFFLQKDRTLLDTWLADSMSWFSQYRHMNTAAEQKTDRVLTYNATVPLSCYLGDAPNRNRWVNLTAVSYEGFRGEDFAALVWDAGADRLKVALYNFRQESIKGLLRTRRLHHGRYTLRIGQDLNDDGDIDLVTDTHEMVLHDYAPINLQLEPRRITIVEVTRIEALEDIRDRADLAVSPWSSHLQDDGLHVTVHNIGIKPVSNVTVQIMRGGKVLESKLIEQIEAPLDLKPRSVKVTFASAKAGDLIVVDPQNSISEIAEHNNRLEVLH